MLMQEVECSRKLKLPKTYNSTGGSASLFSITDAAKAKIIPDEIACVLLHLCFSVSNPRALWNHCKAFPLNGFWF